MFEKLRIVFTILSAAFVLPVIFLAAFIDILWGVVCAAVALIFFLLAAHFKRLQEAEAQESTPKGDFFSPLPAEPQAQESENTENDGDSESKE